MLSIVGTVDHSIGFDTLGGWARYSEQRSPESIEVFASLGDEFLGRCFVTLPRLDLKGNFGFSLRLSRKLTAAELKSDQFRVAARGEGQTATLRMQPKTIETFALRELGATLQSRSDSEIRHLLDGLTGGAGSPLLRAVAQRIKEFSFEGKPDSHFGSASQDELSAFELQVGLKSRDNSAVIGRDGYMFILGGSNQLFDQYRQDINDTKIQEISDKWISLIKSRYDALESRNIRFLQMFIPEKASVAKEFFPADINPPTATFRAIRKKLDNLESLGISILDGYEEIIKNTHRLDIFRKSDSHLSAMGAYTIFSAMMRQFGLSVPWHPEFNRRRIFASDLGSKFTVPSMPEPVLTPSASFSSAISQNLACVEEVVPPGGRHLGTRMVWKNPTAPCRLKAVAFGNSFFERGGNEAGLSWWAARYFAEFHFFWKPEIDFEYVDAVKPDLVIAQSIERFLALVPES